MASRFGEPIELYFFVGIEYYMLGLYLWVMWGKNKKDDNKYKDEDDKDRDDGDREACPKYERVEPEEEDGLDYRKN